MIALNMKKAKIKAKCEDASMLGASWNRRFPSSLDSWPSSARGRPPPSSSLLPFYFAFCLWKNDCFR